tara:strand:- start:8796 stop:10487 length:1692 start_codon:yes stop_codon:yes gene_type:complete
MKKLSFKKLWIVSDKERRARAEAFSETETLVSGANRTGKSSFIKSIYASLGADPKKNNDKWLGAEPKLLMEFEINGETNYTLRVGNNIAFFDSSRQLRARHHGITKAAISWSNLLDVNIKFPGKNGLINPWPAALFLPFYIDQDTGLNDTWSSFLGLEAYSSPKDTLVDFHTGLKPKSYYIAKAKKDAAMSRYSEKGKEREHLEFAGKKLETLTIDNDLQFSVEGFENEIERYLVLQNKFNEKREKVRLKIRDLQGKRTALLQERQLAAATLKELEADATYLEKIDTSELVCPTCNTVHEVSFANTLRLSGDAATCRDYLAGTDEEIRKATQSLEDKKKSLREFENEIAEIEQILGEKRGEISLRTLLEHESRRIAGDKLQQEKENIDVEIRAIEEKINGFAKEMKGAQNKELRNEILEYYQTKLRAFCNNLNIMAPPEKMFLKIRPAIDDTGSEFPRLVLAYHYAILHVVAKYTSAVLAPIVFDTAQHQDQDGENINAMIRFAFEQRPEGTQFVFGGVETYDYKYEGHTINTTNKRHLLNEESYDECKKQIAPFVAQFLSAD